MGGRDNVGAFEQVFPRAVIAKLFAESQRRDLRHRRYGALHRHDVVTARGEFPVEMGRWYEIRQHRAERASWDAYLEAAAATGVLDDDVIARLQGDEEDHVRSALAECMVAWLFAGRLGLRLTARPPGRGMRRPEYRVDHPATPFIAEVKAPREDDVPDGVWCGNGAPKLEASLIEANKQFAAGDANVLVMAPQLQVPVTNDRYQFVMAFLGEFELVVTIDRRTGGPAGPCENRFSPKGRFTRYDKQKGEPRFTRVSAAVVVEETFIDPVVHRGPFTRAEVRDAAARGDNRPLWERLAYEWTEPSRSSEQMWIGHNVFVIHNPYAKHPIDRAVFGDFPQLVRVDDEDGSGFVMAWTDGHRIGPGHD